MLDLSDVNVEWFNDVEECDHVWHTVDDDKAQCIECGRWT